MQVQHTVYFYYSFDGEGGFHRHTAKLLEGDVIMVTLHDGCMATTDFIDELARHQAANFQLETEDTLDGMRLWIFHSLYADWQAARQCLITSLLATGEIEMSEGDSNVIGF